MQDVRSYERKLTLEEIYELHAMPAKSDLHPVSGYLEFRQGETNKSFIISARDDNEEEGEELFILKIEWYVAIKNQVFKYINTLSEMNKFKFNYSQKIFLKLKHNLTYNI